MENERGEIIQIQVQCHVCGFVDVIQIYESDEIPEHICADCFKQAIP